MATPGVNDMRCLSGQEKRREIKLVRKQCENFHMFPGWRKRFLNLQMRLCIRSQNRDGTYCGSGQKISPNHDPLVQRWKLGQNDIARWLQWFARTAKCFHAKCVDLIVLYSDCTDSGLSWLLTVQCLKPCSQPIWLKVTNQMAYVLCSCSNYCYSNAAMQIGWNMINQSNNM